jgi:Zn-dependent protease with chaperone function
VGVVRECGSEIKKGIMMGYALAFLIVATDCSAVSYLSGEWSIALFVAVFEMLYIWLGERVTVFRTRTVRKAKLKEWERDKLAAAQKILSINGRKYGFRSCKYRIHVINTTEYNAYCYGRRHIAVTRPMLNLPPRVISAVLAHEIGHARRGDVLFSRILYLNISTAVIALSGFGILASVMLVGSTIATFILAGFLSGVVVMYANRTLKYLVQVAENVLRWLLYTTFKLINAVYSRKCEYHADRFSCKLGLGEDLNSFLESLPRQRFKLFHLPTLNDLLYGSHPPTKKRIKRIQKFLTKE